MVVDVSKVTSSGLNHTGVQQPEDTFNHTGAVVGIVTAMAVVIFIGTFAFFFIRYRRKRHAIYQRAKDACMFTQQPFEVVPANGLTRSRGIPTNGPTRPRDIPTKPWPQRQDDLHDNDSDDSDIILYRPHR